MFQIDAMSRTPVYEQIISQVEKFILGGVLRAGDQLPSVRSLSIELWAAGVTREELDAAVDRGVRKENAP